MNEPSATPKKKRRLVAFSLRTLFIVFTLATVICGGYAIYFRPYRLEREAEAALVKKGKMFFIRLPDPNVPNWLRYFDAKHFMHVSELKAPRQLDDDDLRLIGRFTRLNSLKLSSPKITDAGTAHLVNLKQLGTLDLRGSKITEKSLPALAQLTGLFDLRLELPLSDEILLRFPAVAKRMLPNAYQFERVTPDGFEFFLEHARVNDRSFHIRDSVLSEPNVARFLAQKPRRIFLQSVTIDRAGQVRLLDYDDPDFSILTDRASLSPSLFSERFVPAAESAVIGDSLITLNHERWKVRYTERLLPQDWEAFFDRQRLRELRINFPVNKPAVLRRLQFAENLALEFTPEPAAMVELAALPNLQSLTCRVGSAMEDDGLAPLAAAPRLRRLVLQHSERRPEFWRCLAPLSHLDELHLQTMERDGVRDSALPFLAECRGLKHLSLAYSRVTDEGLRELEKFPALRVLELRDCDGVTVEGRQWLRERLPAIEIRN